MECLLKRVVLILSVTAFLAGGHSAVAGNPIGDFFKRLGDSIAYPRSSPPPRRNTKKGTTGKKRADRAARGASRRVVSFAYANAHAHADARAPNGALSSRRPSQQEAAA